MKMINIILGIIQDKLFSDHTIDFRSSHLNINPQHSIQKETIDL